MWFLVNYEGIFKMEQQSSGDMSFVVLEICKKLLAVIHYFKIS
jgi:hypothetical protein